MPSKGKPAVNISFSEKCYQLLRKVPAGRVTTYKAIADYFGSKAYRAVGNAMNRNPYAPEVPCHRVVKSNGEIGGFAQGAGKKQRLLQREGIPIADGRIENLADYLFRFL